MSRTVSIEAQVDIDIPEVLEEADTADLEAELVKRGVSKGGALNRIWIEVMRHGRRLEDVVDDLMRERTWPWRRQGER